MFLNMTKVRGRGMIWDSGFVNSGFVNSGFVNLGFGIGGRDLGLGFGGRDLLIRDSLIRDLGFGIGDWGSGFGIGNLVVETHGHFFKLIFHISEVFYFKFPQQAEYYESIFLSNYFQSILSPSLGFNIFRKILKPIL